MSTCFTVKGAPCGGRRSLAPALRGATSLRAAGVRRRRVTTAAADRGLSGLDIGGSRPTSPRAWEAMSTTLKKTGVKFIAPQEVANAQKRGISVVDIRPATAYAKGRLPDAVNVQLYQLIAGWSPRQLARRINFALFGVFDGTEVNLNFIEDMQAAVPNKSAGVIVVCNVGGTLDEYGPSKFGRQSRSLIAAYELVQAGYKNVQVLRDGYQGWAGNGRPVEYDE